MNSNKREQSMNYKKFIPCIYLYRTKAVKGHEDYTEVSGNPVELAEYYSNNHADSLLVFDLSDGDSEHEEALDIIKAICSAVEIPVIGAGNISRMEDVKKLLYAGCKKASLNYAKASNIEITKEVSMKFGKDKIMATFFNSREIRENMAFIEAYISEGILIDQSCIKESIGIMQLPMIVNLPEISLDKIMEMLKQENISGVTGNTINKNAKELINLKHLCQENGIFMNMLKPAFEWAEFKKNQEGMVPVVTQDYKTAEVLMVAYMNEEAYLNTIQTGKMTYYSRSRRELWIKGDTSGHYQYVKSLTADCDMDTILAKVSQIGAACHTGSRSCFFNTILEQEMQESNPLKVFEDVFTVIKDRKIHPKEGSYTNYLFDKGIDKILKKLGEEATEIVIAAKNPNPNEIKYEISDFLYHMMVLMAEKGVTWEEITKELAQR